MSSPPGGTGADLSSLVCTGHKTSKYSCLLSSKMPLRSSSAAKRKERSAVASSESRLNNFSSTHGSSSFVASCCVPFPPLFNLTCTGRASSSPSSPSVSPPLSAPPVLALFSLLLSRCANDGFNFITACTGAKWSSPSLKTPAT